MNDHIFVAVEIEDRYTLYKCTKCNRTYRAFYDDDVEDLEEYLNNSFACQGGE